MTAFAMSRALCSSTALGLLLHARHASADGFQFVEARRAPHSFQVMQCQTDPPTSAAHCGCVRVAHVPKEHTSSRSAHGSWLGKITSKLSTSLAAWGLKELPTKIGNCGLVEGCHRRGANGTFGVTSCTASVDLATIKSLLVIDHKPPQHYTMCYASTLRHPPSTEFSVNYRRPGPAVGNVTECKVL